MRAARKPVFLIALVCILAGVTVLSMLAPWLLHPFAGSRQHAAQEQLYKSWAGQPGAGGMYRCFRRKGCQMTSQPRTGLVFAIIQIPALGKDWKFTVIEGTDLAAAGHRAGPYPRRRLCRVLRATWASRRTT